MNTDGKLLFYATQQGSFNRGDGKVTDILGIAGTPAHYERDTPWQGGDNGSDRYTLMGPDSLTVNIGGNGYIASITQGLDLSDAVHWDDAELTAAVDRAGKDFYIYACVPLFGNIFDIILSANSTFPAAIPSGETPTVDNTRKIGGFHCLCEDVGTIAGHTLTDYEKGDILPASVWDLNHRPVSAVEGMVYANSGNWVDIYLPSVSGGELVSVNGGTIADGTSTEKFHPYKFDQWFARISKKPIASLEFVDASIGSNQETDHGSDPVTTGGNSDDQSDRMISNIGCEDMCGALGQYGREQGATPLASAWANATDGEDADVGGEHYEAPERPSFGGHWTHGALCGSRYSQWTYSPLILYSNVSSRGVAEPAR